MQRSAHWERIYATKAATEVSWYQEHPTVSLALIASAGGHPGSAVIDVGGGDSRLVDALLDSGLDHVTVLDISGPALSRARERLGPRARQVSWIEGDVTEITLPVAAFDIWHDRAAFHFLTELADRRRYSEAAHSALKPGGWLIVGTFAADGPTRCSGLEVCRYTPEALAAAFGEGFAAVSSTAAVHRTPSGTEQPFTFCCLRRV